MRVDTKMLVDVVDTDNSVIGNMPREWLLPHHLNFRTVHIILVNSSGRWILQKLTEDHPRSPGRLGSSVAGYLRSGETYLEAAHRKLHDELRTRAKLRAVGGFSMPDDKSMKFVEVYCGKISKKPTFDRRQIASLVYLAESEINERMTIAPDQFTETFQHVYSFVKGHVG